MDSYEDSNSNDSRTSSLHLDAAVLKELKNLATNRYQYFEYLVSKYSQIDDDNDATLSISDLEEYSQSNLQESTSLSKLLENTSIDSEDFKVCTKTLNQRSLEIVKIIEHDSESKLYDILLRREKARLLYDYDTFTLQSDQLKIEIERLLHVVSASDVQMYARLTFILKDHVEGIVGDHLGDAFGRALIQQMRCLGKPDKFHRWNNELKQHWEQLLQVLADEDIVPYAVNVLKNYYNWKGIMYK